MMYQTMGSTRRLLDVQDSSFPDPFTEVNAVAFLVSLTGFGSSVGSRLLAIFLILNSITEPKYHFYEMRKAKGREIEGEL